MSEQSRELPLSSNPILAFEVWLKEAIDQKCAEPTAMTLATATKQGIPSARIVLFKGLKAEGFKFFTNFQSPKAHDLLDNPLAALVFLWISPKFQRQIRISGHVEKLGDADSDEYFNTRARGSQIGAWASPQSQKVASRSTLEKMIQEVETRFQNQPVTRPPFWGGFLLNPESIEFWEGRDFRIHERFVFEKNQARWVKDRLAP